MLAKQVISLTCTPRTGEPFDTTVDSLINYLHERATVRPDLISDELRHYGGSLFYETASRYHQLYEEADADPIVTLELSEPYASRQHQLEHRIHKLIDMLPNEPVQTLCRLATVFEGNEPEDETWSVTLSNGQTVTVN